MGPVAIKGGKDGLRLVLAEQVPWDEVLQALREQLGRNPEFFHGVELTIDTGERPILEEELQQLMAAMAEHSLQPTVLATGSREGRTAGRTAGITTRPAIRPAPTATPVVDLDSAFMVQRTLRSGQVLRHPGHITVIGDINPGSEVIAGGSIVVWGRLRGSAHAGALGDESACVCAIELTPTMLRIGTKIARPPESRPSGPEVARVTAQGIEVEPWETGKR
ncbi:MAG: septum site-determining protein MinC [Herpetosiphonaceae bacterium]|nr:septum site-determining protein MinC [Herpetosiphonaceae bacterium]